MKDYDVLKVIESYSGQRAHRHPNKACKGWTTQCQFHDDEGRSLEIYPFNKWSCEVCHSPRQLMTALQFVMGAERVGPEDARNIIATVTPAEDHEAIRDRLEAAWAGEFSPS